LEGDIARDHVPPKQIYAQEIRKRHDLNLFRLPVHKPCNESYQKDEEYFVATVTPVVGDTYAGRALWNDARKKWARPEGERLGQMIINEFDRIVLPGGIASKRFDAVRVRRVIWKITRGLFFKQQKRFLPEEKPKHISVTSRLEKPDQELGYVLAYVTRTKSKGRYPGVFDYKYADIPEGEERHRWLWAMLFWDSLISLTIFHDPVCTCLECEGNSKESP